MQPNSLVTTLNQMEVEVKTDGCGHMSLFTLTRVNTAALVVVYVSTPLTPEQEGVLGITEMYIDAHPEGADRGGYVPYVKSKAGRAMYNVAGEIGMRWQDPN